MRVLRDLACAGLAAILALLACEGCLRLAGVKYEASFFTAEAERGYALRPYAEGWEAGEGDNYVQINSAGMYDREHTLARPADTIRIAMLGSSEAEANQVRYDENFAGVLERTLNRKLEGSGRRVETLNFGVGGYNLAQMYLTLHDRVWQYDPQVVIVSYSNNLVLKNTPELDQDTPNDVRFMTIRDGRLEPDADSQAKMARRLDRRRLRLRGLLADLTNRSRVLSLANVTLSHLSERWSGWKSAWRKAGATAGAAATSALPADYQQVWPFLSPEDETPPADPRLGRASEVGDAIFLKMNQEAREHGAEFWLFVLDIPLQVNPDEALRSAFMKQHGMEALDRAERRLLAFCARQGIHAAALAPALLPSIPPGVAIRGFPGHDVGDGHYNLTGHILIGEYLADLLYRNSALLPPPTP
jgi:hypothetical protein